MNHALVNQTMLFTSSFRILGAFPHSGTQFIPSVSVKQSVISASTTKLLKQHVHTKGWKAQYTSITLIHLIERKVTAPGYFVKFKLWQCWTCFVTYGLCKKWWQYYNQGESNKHEITSMLFEALCESSLSTSVSAALTSRSAILCVLGSDRM